MKIHFTNEPFTILYSIKEPHFDRMMITLVLGLLSTFPTYTKTLLILLILLIISTIFLIILNNIHKMLYIILITFNIHRALTVFWCSKFL